MRALALAAAALLALPAAASAFYGNGAAIESADYIRLEQGDAASTIGALSTDGRFVAFQTQASNFFADSDPDPPGDFRRGGVFRRTVDGPALEKVADGDLRPNNDPSTLLVRGAQNPSISADGRYVAFSTAQRLVPADVNDNVDVYVRDMTKSFTDPTAYTLVSAKDGGDVPASYGPPPGGHTQGGDQGSEVYPIGAISADGRKVLFRTPEVSDLPARPTPDTPSGQLFVRDLDTHTTTLVTRVASGAQAGDPAGGAIGPQVLSGDGTTVAWTGARADLETEFLPGEPAPPAQPFYLWRRIADGPGAPTRRITGATDLDDPGCDHSFQYTPNSTATGPCYGPLTVPEGGQSPIATKAPSLSADGYRVAFLTGSSPRPNLDTGPARDLWVTDMRPGLSRKSGSRELTRDPPIATDPGTAGDIDLATISGDGQRIALVTNRTRMILPSPRLVGSLRRNPDGRDVLLIDLPADTIERVSRAYDGRDANGDASQTSLSLSSDGDRIVFPSTASNLLRGDANQVTDVFMAARTAEPQATGDLPPEPFVEPPIPDIGSLAPPGDLEVRAKSLPKGVVQLLITVPETGQIDAVAKTVPTSAGSSKRKPKPKPKAQTVSTGTVKDAQEGSVTLKLTPLARFRSQIRHKGRISGRVAVSFRPSSAASSALASSVRVNFVWQPHKTKKPAKKRKPAHRK
jgi:hypothetical protein